MNLKKVNLKSVCTLILSVCMVLAFMLVFAWETSAEDMPTSFEKDLNKFDIPEGGLKDGTYYLGDDMTITKPLVIAGNVYLNLDGNTLKLELAEDDKNQNKPGSVIQINENATLHLYDTSQDKPGEITGGIGTYVEGSTRWGGGVFNKGTFNMYGGAISGNNVDVNGGGVYNYGSFNMYDGEIRGNTAKWNGGGVYSEGEFIMKRGDISNNEVSDENGGGVYIKSGKFTLDGGDITGNDAKIAGGGVYVFSDGQFIMKDGNINGNTADDGSGGGVCNYGTFTMNGGRIGNKDEDNSKNTAGTYGGGVYNYGSFNMYGGEISANIAKETGGGVYNYGTLTLEKGEINNNEACAGGGIDNSGTVTMKTNVEIKGNKAEPIEGNSYSGNNEGGGVRNNDTFTMEGGQISENEAIKGGSSSAYGSGVYNNDTFTMSSGEIKKNRIDNKGWEIGGGVYIDSGSFQVSGDVQITENINIKTEYVSAVGSDVQLNSSNNAKITIAGPLDLEKAKIGVNVTENPNSDEATIITNGLEKWHSENAEDIMSKCFVNNTRIDDDGNPVIDEKGRTIYIYGKGDLLSLLIPDTEEGENKDKNEIGLMFWPNHYHLWRYEQNTNNSNTIQLNCIAHEGTVISKCKYAYDDPEKAKENAKFFVLDIKDVDHEGKRVYNGEPAEEDIQDGIKPFTGAYIVDGIKYEPVDGNASLGDDGKAVNVGTYRVAINLDISSEVDQVIKDGQRVQREGEKYSIVIQDVSKTFEIVAKSLRADGVTVSIPDTIYEYKGTAHEPEVTVKDGDTPLVQDTDYTVKYDNNTEPGQATVTIEGKGNYTGTVALNFNIVKETTQGDGIMPAGYTDPDGDGVYEDPDSNRAIPDQDNDGKPEPESDMEPGIYDGSKDDKKYVPDGKGNVEEVTDPDGDGIYEDKNGIKYVPDQDGDGIPEPDTDGDGIFEGTKDDKKYGTGDIDIGKKVYDVLGGSLVWILGGTEDLTFTIDASAEKFKKLIIDGETVSKEDYDYESGSTVITLEADYLNSLNVGSYAVEAVYTDGKAVTTLKIKAVGSGEGSDTGDESNMLPWLLLMMTALTAGAITVAGRRYQKN